MKEIIVGAKEKGQRFDKFLIKFFPKAGSGFLYKMLRKKNITLNDKKADGSERLQAGDVVKVFFSDETFEKFTAVKASSRQLPVSLEHQYLEAYKNLKGISILTETEDVIVLNKPAGVLSQRAGKEDVSASEWLIGYLLSKGFPIDFSRYKPSVCNRLDRNTSGILLCAKTYLGSRFLSDQIQSHRLQKYYIAVAEGSFPEISGNTKDAKGQGAPEAIKEADRQGVSGIAMDDNEQGISGAAMDGKVPEYSETSTDAKEQNSSEADPFYLDLRAWLYKDTEKNKVKVYRTEDRIPADIRSQCSEIHTGYRILQQNKDYALLEIRLVTGKSHQIRAQFAALGHPLAGDVKYGGHPVSGYHSQMLHAAKVVFPDQPDAGNELSGKCVICQEPELFRQLTQG